MSSNKNIGRALFQVEKTALWIVFMIIAINLLINGLVTVLDQATPGDYFVTQTIFNVTLFGFVYLMIYGINQVVTSVPFLVSLNCPQKLLARNVINKGAGRSFIVTVILLLIKLTVYRAEYGLSSSLFGIELTASSLSDNLILAGIIYAALYLVYSLVTFISLLGVRFGWEYVLTAAFVILGSGFLLARAIVLLLIFGWNLRPFILLLLLLITGLNLINYRLIKNFEYKS